MKNLSKRYFIMIALGLLVMNSAPLLNIFFNTNINQDLIDFLKGLGVAILVWGAIKLVGVQKKCNL